MDFALRPESSRSAQALRKAVKVAGSQSAMARMLHVTQGAISKWIAAGKELPAEHVLTVERGTGISRHDLRPDLYPRESIEPSASMEAAR